MIRDLKTMNYLKELTLKLVHDKNFIERLLKDLTIKTNRIKRTSDIINYLEKYITFVIMYKENNSYEQAYNQLKKGFKTWVTNWTNPEFKNNKDYELQKEESKSINKSLITIKAEPDIKFDWKLSKSLYNYFHLSNFDKSKQFIFNLYFSDYGEVLVSLNEKDDIPVSKVIIKDLFGNGENNPTDNCVLVYLDGDHKNLITTNLGLIIVDSEPDIITKTLNISYSHYDKANILTKGIGEYKFDIGLGERAFKNIVLESNEIILSETNDGYVCFSLNQNKANEISSLFLFNSSKNPKGSIDIFSHVLHHFLFGYESGIKLNCDFHLHHLNFIKTDNRLTNLIVLHKDVHRNKENSIHPNKENNKSEFGLWLVQYINYIRLACGTNYLYNYYYSL